MSKLGGTSADQAPLRVLVMSDHLGRRNGQIHGGTTYFVTVLPALAKAGVELTACFMAPRHPAAEILERESVRPIFLGDHKLDPRSLGRVAAIVRDRRIQLLHLSSFKSQFLGRLVAGRHGRRAIIHLHDTVPLPSHVRWLQRRVAQWTDLCLAVSKPVARLGVTDYGLPRRQIVVLHNALDLDRFAVAATPARHRLCRELSIDPTAKLIGVVGRLDEMKGQALAIRAMPRVLEAFPRAVLLLCGEGPRRADYEQLVAASGLGEVVRFAGQLSDMPSVLAALDVVAMPSMFGEGLPFAAIEAMAAGKPVVGFPDSGIPEIVRHGETGILVPKGDVAALAAGLAEVLGDERLHAELCRGARAHARNFSVEHHVERLTGIYRHLIHGVGAPPSAAWSAGAPAVT